MKKTLAAVVVLMSITTACKEDPKAEANKLLCVDLKTQKLQFERTLIQLENRRDLIRSSPRNAYTNNDMRNLKADHRSVKTGLVQLNDALLKNNCI